MGRVPIDSFLPAGSCVRLKKVANKGHSEAQEFARALRCRFACKCTRNTVRSTHTFYVSPLRVATATVKRHDSAGRVYIHAILKCATLVATRGHKKREKEREKKEQSRKKENTKNCLRRELVCTICRYLDAVRAIIAVI